MTEEDARAKQMAFQYCRPAFRYIERLEAEVEHQRRLKLKAERERDMARVILTESSTRR